MEEFKADLQKFGSVIDSTFQSDSVFKNLVIDAIQKKELGTTLRMLQAKAKDVGNELQWSVDDKKEFAYAMFVVIVSQTDMPKPNAIKMAATVYNRITGLNIQDKPYTPSSSPPPITGLTPQPSSPQITPMPTPPSGVGPKKPSFFAQSPSGSPTSPSPYESAPSAGPQVPSIRPQKKGSIFGSALGGMAAETNQADKVKEKLEGKLVPLLLLFTKSILLRDSDLVEKLKFSISRKDRVGVNSIAKESAIKYGGEMGIGVDEKRVLAYFLFREVMKMVSDIPTDLKHRMAETIYQNLTDRTDYGKMVMELENADQLIEAGGLNAPNAINEIKFDSSLYEDYFKDGVPEVPQGKVIDSELSYFLSTIVPGSISHLIIAAKLALIENVKLKIEVQTAIGSFDPRKVMGACLEEAHASAKDFGFTEEQEKLFSFFLFYYAFQDYNNPNINAQRKQVMTGSIFKNMVGKEFDPFYSEFTRVEGALIGHRVFEIDLMNDILSGKYLTSESKTIVQRAIQRKALADAKEEEKTQEKIASVEGVADRIEAWLRSDNKFVKKVNQIDKLDANTIMVIFNPDSEGYITEAKVMGTGYRTRNMFLVKLLIEAKLPFPNPYDVAIGLNQKGNIVACTLMGSINLIDQVISEINSVNNQNSLDWDTFMFRLNSEKKIMKTIKNLGLKPPTDEIKEDIIVPVKIRKGKPVIMTLETYMLKEIKPSTIFFDIFDGMADILEDISDEDDQMGGMSISSKLVKLGEKQERDWSGYEFKYLAADDAVDLRLCPGCGKPFPDHRAEYRRCPNCLYKIDPTFWMQ